MKFKNSLFLGLMAGLCLPAAVYSVSSWAQDLSSMNTAQASDQLAQSTDYSNQDSNTVLDQSSASDSDWGGGHGGGGHGGGGFHPGPHPGPGPFPGPHPGPHPFPGHDPFPHHGGAYPWPHWNHPPFIRPIYGWDWGNLVSVTCTAEDSQGELFPITEDGYVGLGYQAALPEIEDAAIDYCYNSTGGDQSCSLVDCEPTY